MGTFVRTRSVALVAAAVLCAGCWNGNGSNRSIHLGNVSIGQQMIDLKAALEQEAITQAEYERLRKALMALDEACEDRED